MQGITARNPIGGFALGSSQSEAREGRLKRFIGVAL